MKKYSVMFLSRLFLLALAGATVVAPMAEARPGRARDQDEALRALQEGRIMPLRSIESMIIPRMRGFEYLGPELDPSSGRYRLKFLRGSQVVWVDVDARTGHIVGTSGR